MSTLENADFIPWKYLVISHKYFLHKEVTLEIVTIRHRHE